MFLSDIGKSDDIRRLVSRTDVDGATISLILDKPRTLAVVRKTPSKEELTVIAKDSDDEAIVVLHLPFAENTSAQATITEKHRD